MTTEERIADFLAWSSAWLSESDGREMAPYLLRAIDSDEELLAAKEEWSQRMSAALDFAFSALRKP